jgi:CheY-like chemotaxis protein
MMGSMTAEELARRLREWQKPYLDVTVTTPDGVHHNIANVVLTADNEGDEVISLELEVEE